MARSIRSGSPPRSPNLSATAARARAGERTNGRSPAATQLTTGDGLMAIMDAASERAADRSVMPRPRVRVRVGRQTQTSQSHPYPQTQAQAQTQPEVSLCHPGCRRMVTAWTRAVQVAFCACQSQWTDQRPRPVLFSFWWASWWASWRASWWASWTRVRAWVR